MKYLVEQSQAAPDEWLVEAVGSEHCGAIFNGPDAQLRAREYALLKSTIEQRPCGPSKDRARRPRSAENRGSESGHKTS
jgi:hypothetical protein